MRKTIRDTVKAALENLSDLAHVEIGRRHDLESGHLPGAIIYTDGENSSRLALKEVRHVVDLRVVLYLKPDGEVLGEDDVDDLIEKIDLAAVTRLEALSGIHDVFPASLDVDGDGDADADYLTVTRSFTVEYHTSDT